MKLLREEEEFERSQPAVRTEKVPMASPDITDHERRAVNQVLGTKSLSMGPQLKLFERTFARYIGAKHAVGVNSGTSGLHLAVTVSGVQPGDLVVTTPFSFVASATCILHAHAIPVFVDVQPETGNIDPRLAKMAVEDLHRGSPAASKWLPNSVAQLKKGAKVRAILPVHAFGEPADLDPLSEVCKKFGLALIEDACEAIGAEYKGKRVGGLGDVAVFAFYPNKQMTTGEGGMIVTNDQQWDRLLRSLRNQGRSDSGRWLAHERIGFNYRLDELSSALGAAQLSRIDELLEKRAKVAAWYEERLAGLEFVKLYRSMPSTTHRSWFVLVVRIAAPLCRDKVIAKLQSRGIPSRPYFPPIHLQPAFRALFGYREGAFSVAARLGKESLALPFSGVMTQGQVELVCNCLSDAIRESRPRC